MAEHKPTYFAYLLRLWRADDDEEPVWRASLQSPGGEERRGFASLEELFAFLRGQVGLAPQQEGAKAAPDSTASQKTEGRE